LAISAYIISKHKIKQANISEPLAVRKEMTENPEETLWIHADDPGNIFQLRDIFGLHPLAVDAIVHRHQPSEIEEFDRYVFTIIDGVRYEEQANDKVRRGREESNKEKDGNANSDPKMTGICF